MAARRGCFHLVEGRLTLEIGIEAIGTERNAYLLDSTRARLAKRGVPVRFFRNTCW